MIEHQRILVYQVGGIGDTLVMLPAFRALRREFPSARLELLNLSTAASIVQRELYGAEPLFDRMTFLPCPDSLFHRLRLRLRLLAFPLFQRADTLFVFAPGSPRFLLAGFRIAGGRKTVRCWETNDSRDLPWRMKFAEVLARHAIPVDPEDYRLCFTQEEKKRAQKILADAKIPEDGISVVFGLDGNQEVCRWSLDAYRELIRRMRQKWKVFPLYAGGEPARPGAQALQSEFGGFFLLDAGADSLRITAAVIAFCRVYLGNDTGAAHLAASAGIPCIVISPCHDLPPSSWRPAGKQVCVLRADGFPCAGCGLKACPKGAPPPCLTAVAPSAVLARLAEWKVFA